MGHEVVIREYAPTDIAQVLGLFYDTVHSVNARDYSAEQLDAWAPAHPDRHAWMTRLAKNNTYVADLDGLVVGFGAISGAGFIDVLYTHRDYQSQGIGSRLLTRLEQHATASRVARICVEASITATPFFESKGYRISRSLEKRHRGLLFTTNTLCKDVPGR